MIDPALLHKYNVPIPRYTSYPTVPYWKEDIEKTQWKQVFAEQFMAGNRQKGISIYLHLPFCESLCTFCGCNKKITTNHSVENEYIEALLKEWKMYLALMPEKPVIREIHLGGGTPTFFSPANLHLLLSSILKDGEIHPSHDFGLEGHPNNTTREHLQTLYDHGFRRVSYGVQDINTEVQHIINRIQPFERVIAATETARSIGYTSVNFDLVYGLPRQTMVGMEQTISQCITLKPDRVAFYSYAHVPWTSKGQRLFDENDLPGAEEKMKLYVLGKELFTKNDYIDIGMDHFSLPGDDLYTAFKENRLHRNFMGYTTQQSAILLGMGVSSISDTGNAFAQNEKTIHDYYDYINKGELAVKKGYFLSQEDLSFKRYILDLSCNGITQFRPEDMEAIKTYSFPVLESLAKDELVTFNELGASATPLGRHFIRNICSAFDLYLQRAKSDTEQKKFSKAI